MVGKGLLAERCSEHVRDEEEEVGKGLLLEVLMRTSWSSHQAFSRCVVLRKLSEDPPF